MLRRRSFTAAGITLVAGCAGPARGPDTGETAGLRRRVEATVVRVALQARRVVALDVATGRQQSLGATPGPVWQLSPPDRRGALAIVTPAAEERRYAVQLLAKNHAQALLEGAGDPLWDDPLGAPMLSDDGRWLLAVAHAEPGARFQPLFVGHLRCWSTDSGQERTLGRDPVLALGERPAWSQAGRQVVFAAPGPRGRAAPTPLSPSLQPDPQIRRLDLATGRQDVLVEGHQPVVSNDGLSMLLRAAGSRAWVWWDLATASARPMHDVAGLRVPLALVDSRYLVYTGEPAPGTEVGTTSRNSPLVGPKPLLALKVADLATGAHETLLGSIDPREVLAARAGLLGAPA